MAMAQGVRKVLWLKRILEELRKADGVICMSFVPTFQQLADILTKGLFQLNFEFLGSNLNLGMMDIYAPT
ncbi:hypothetical protein CR513_30116, partial [Mucuna pruriens]